MKKLQPLLLIILFLATFFIPGGCKKSSTPNDIGAESIDIPGVMMTLSAISYTKDSMSTDTITKSIKELLNNTSIATKGQWNLVWGPGISPDKENMIFVTKYMAVKTPVYAITIRGTNISSHFDDFEDLDVFELVQFPFGQAGDMVSWGALDGLNLLRNTQDPVTGSILQTFLENLSSDAKIPLFITGHSQGGSLAPVVTYWLLSLQGFPEKFTISTYGFAGPAVVNQSFKENFLRALPTDSSFHMYVNTLDVMPYFWSNLPGIIANNIPVLVPPLYFLAINKADSILVKKGIKYHDIVVADPIGFIPVTPNPDPFEMRKYYDHWLLVQHNHNNYLRLLGVDTIP